MEMEMVHHPVQPLGRPSNWYEVRCCRPHLSAGGLCSSRCRAAFEVSEGRLALSEPKIGT